MSRMNGRIVHNHRQGSGLRSHAGHLQSDMQASADIFSTVPDIREASPAVGEACLPIGEADEAS